MTFPWIFPWYFSRSEVKPGMLHELSFERTLNEMFWFVVCLSRGYLRQYFPSAGKTKEKNRGSIVLEAEGLSSVCSTGAKCAFIMQALANVSEGFHAFQTSVQETISGPLKQSRNSSPSPLITVSCDYWGSWGEGYFLQCQASNSDLASAIFGMEIGVKS